MRPGDAYRKLHTKLADDQRHENARAPLSAIWIMVRARHAILFFRRVTASRDGLVPADDEPTAVREHTATLPRRQPAAPCAYTQHIRRRTAQKVFVMTSMGWPLFERRS